MGLRLEGSGSDAEPPAEPAGHAADAGDHCRLVLLGFRNDLAQHRVLTVLREWVAAPPADLKLPYTVYERIDGARAARLAAEFEERGAVVRLTRLDGAADDGAETTHTSFAPLRDELPPSDAGFALPPHTLRLLVLVAIGAASVIWLMRPSADGAVEAPVSAPRASRAKPAAARPVAHAQPARLHPSRVKQLIASGDFAAAEQAVAAALEAGDDVAGTALQGQLHEKRGNWPAARTAYERAVELGSEDPDVFLSLSALYRQQGRQEEAVVMLHRAQQNGAKGRDFEAMKQLVVAEQDAEAGFGSFNSPHFTIAFDAGEDGAAAQLVLAQLEDAYLTVGHKLGQYPDHDTPVVLYAERDFQRVTHSPGWAGALYDGRIKVPVGGVQSANPAELARTIRHEYAHALVVALSGGNCPVWLNEGVAMWAEEARDGEREEWALGAIQVSRRPFTLAELEKSFAHLSPQDALGAYAQSYLAVRHLVARYGDRALQRLITAYASGASSADAFRDALPIELSSFEDDLRREQSGG